MWIGGEAMVGEDDATLQSDSAGECDGGNAVDLTEQIDLRESDARWRVQWGGPSGPVAQRGKELERDVFVESLGYSAELVESEFASRDASSVWVVMSDRRTGSTVGSCRLEVAPRNELKINSELRRFWGVELDHLLAERNVSPSDRIIEVLTASVAPDVRKVDNHWPVRALFAAGAYLVRELGTTWLLQIQDVHGPDLMRRRFGLDYEILGELEPVDMLGPIVPSICHIGADGLRFADPEFADVFFNGDRSTTDHTVVDPLDPALIEIGLTGLGVPSAG